MKKIITAVAFLSLALASTVSAQTYYQPQYPQYPQGAVTVPTVMPMNATLNSICVSISRNLARGSRGSDVEMLQNFLMSSNYAAQGRVTGYFGSLTAQALMNFQRSEGIASTGTTGPRTRSAIARLTCTGGAMSPQSSQMPAYPYQSQQGTAGSYYNCANGQGNCQQPSLPQTGPTITSMTPQPATIGGAVTIYGAGFSTSGNTVRFGAGIVTNLVSPDTQSVSFNVPVQLSGYSSQVVGAGTYDVSVTNNRGSTSNTLPLTVAAGTTYSTGVPTFAGVSGPTNLSVNASGTWSVSLVNQNGVSATVTVDWGDGASAAPQNIYSTGPQTLSYTHTFSTSGIKTLTFRVMTTGGQSNTTTATVTVGAQTSGAPYISALSPTQGSLGTQIAIIGTGFNGLDNMVRFGNGGTMHLPSANGTTIYFTVPYYVSPCDVSGGGLTCAQGQQPQQVSPGTYQVSVTSNGVTSNTATYVVQ